MFLSHSVSGVDIVLNHRLVETGFGDKKGFTAYLKAYMKKVLGYLEENDRKDEIAEFKSNINNVMKEMMGKFKDLQFYTGKTLLYIHGVWKLPVLIGAANFRFSKSRLIDYF